VPQNPKHRRLIGDNIREYRKKAGFSQEKLAEKADLHPVYISQVERAERAITIDSLLRITKALRIRLRDIVGEL
jgi:transcriptional regulator with XRE-family HTH domain